VINGGGKVPGSSPSSRRLSFATNTDWQSYEPEQMFTHFSQTVRRAALFLLLRVGIAVAAVVVRGVARKQTTDIGNFWVDLTRITLYLFLPICLVFATLDVWQGIPMNFRPYTSATALDQSGAASPGRSADDRAGPDGVVLRAQGAGPQRPRHSPAPTAPSL
jgi:K+-transporting ATPase ATPase A chain